MAESGHHSPVSLYALIHAASVLRLHSRRLAAVVLLSPSNRNHDIANKRAASSNMGTKSTRRVLGAHPRAASSGRRPPLRLVLHL